MSDVQEMGHARRALIVDDEEPLAKLLAGYLERDGFTVSIATDGPNGLAEARRLEPDLVVLDLGLPGLDGVELCKQLRQFSDCYVLMLTARTDEADKLLGLDSGADDYVTKPFSPSEVAARARALLRRTREARPGHSVVADLSVDRDRHEVRRGDTSVDLTRTELDVLLAFVDRPGMALGRRQVLDIVWGANWVGDDNLVDVHIARLRRKLGPAEDGRHYVETVRGIGYRLRGPA